MEATNASTSRFFSFPVELEGVGVCVCVCVKITCFYAVLGTPLPVGFVLKKDKKKMDEQEEKISLDDLIEKEVCRYYVLLPVFAWYSFTKPTAFLSESGTGRKLDEGDFRVL